MTALEKLAKVLAGAAAGAVAVAFVLLREDGTYRLFQEPLPKVRWTDKNRWRHGE